jgi:HEAT repeat protein
MRPPCSVVLLIFLFGISTGTACLFALVGCSSEAPPQPPVQLIETAAAETSPPESRREAARELLAHPQAKREDYRRLAQQAQDPVVRATAYTGMGRKDDWDSMPELLTAMEDPDPYVRGQAGAAVAKILRLDMGFKANAPEDERARIIADLRMRYNKLKGHYHGERQRN